MPYVHRSVNGEVESLHRAATLGAAEFLDAADPDVQRFLNQQQADAAAPVRLDVLIEATMGLLGMSREQAELELREICEALHVPLDEVGHA